MEIFKNPNDLSKKMITSNDDMYREQLKSLGIPENEHDEYLKSIAQSEKESQERERVKTAQQTWQERNNAKPYATTPEQLEKIRQAAIDEFGITPNFRNAFYMLPDGRMLDGSGGQGRRVYDHRDIGSSYINSNIDIQELDQGGNSHNMLDFMRGGHIRIMPESDAVDIMSKPTTEQMNQIYRLWRLGKLNNIQVSDAKDKYGQQLGYLENIENERQIADFLRKYYS